MGEFTRSSSGLWNRGSFWTLAGLGEKEGTAVVALGEGGARLGHGVSGGGDLDVAGGADAFGVHEDDGFAAAFFVEAGVDIVEMFVDAFGLLSAAGEDFVEFLFAFVEAVLKFGDVFVNEPLSSGE